MVSFLSVSLSLAVCGSLSLLLLSLSLSLVLSVVECVFFFALFLLFHSPSLCLTFFFLSAPFSSRLVVFCLLFCVLLGLVPRVCVLLFLPSFLLQFFSFFTFVLLFYLFLSLHLGLWFVFHQFCFLLLSFLFLLFYVIVYCLLCVCMAFFSLRLFVFPSFM